MAGRTKQHRDQDIAFMRMALREAKKGVGLTSPNPPVGCVIVKDGQVLGKGWHRKAGMPHAEREALAAVRKYSGGKSVQLLRGASLYVTLEPCSTTGQTPPCTEGIIDAGIKRVVYAATDPNPDHAGRAAELLRKHQVKVTTGTLEEDAALLLRPFAKRILTGLPWVIAKAALSLDGRITRPTGESQWLTSSNARADAQKIRARSDAIVVGAATVREDNPRLTLRGPGVRTGKLQPWRVVLTRSGNLPDDSHLFTDSNKHRTLIFKRRSLRFVLQQLASRGATTVMIEGGGNVLAQAFSRGLVDEVCLYIAPLISGTGNPVIDPSVFTGPSIAIDDLNVRRLGNDIRISGTVNNQT